MHNQYLDLSFDVNIKVCYYLDAKRGAFTDVVTHHPVSSHIPHDRQTPQHSTSIGLGRPQQTQATSQILLELARLPMPRRFVNDRWEMVIPSLFPLS